MTRKFFNALIRIIVMKMKNIVMIVAFGVFGQLLVATEIEIQNNSGWMMDAQAELSFGGKPSLGKLFTNIANNDMRKYNSGIYTITGFKVKLKKEAPNMRGWMEKAFSVKEGRMTDWPRLGVTNRSASFTMDSDTGGFVLSDKAKPAAPARVRFNSSERLEPINTKS